MASAAMKSLCLLFLLAMESFAAITLKGTPVTCSVTATASPCVASQPVVVSIGDAILVATLRSSPASTVPVISDSCNHQWQSALVNGGANYPDLWITLLSPTAGSCIITSTRTPTTSSGDQAFVALVYSGVGSFLTNASGGGGGPAGTPTNRCAGPNLTLTAGQLGIGGFIVTGTGASTATLASYSSGTYVGNLRGSVSGINLPIAITDVPGAGTFSVSLGMSSSGTIGCNRVAFTLVPGTITTAYATVDQRSKTLLLASPTSSSFAFPNTLLSSIWCAYPLAAGVDYDLPVQAPSVFNGTASVWTLHSWQGSRVCQDKNKNYWGRPSITGGAGISVSPTPILITIAVSARSGGGITAIGGGQILAGGCVLRNLKNLPAVRAGDYVGFTPDHDPHEISNFAYISIAATAKKNQVEFRVCNRSDTNIYLDSFNLNWYAEP